MLSSEEAGSGIHSSRPVVITGNWKMYKTISEAVNFIENLAPLIGQCQAKVYLAVPFTAIRTTVQKIAEIKAPIAVGAQNMNDASEGAFTGEIAGRMLKEAGAEFVIVGHSERRHLFHESNEFVNNKVKRAFLDHLQPTLCIGETLEEREQGKTELVLEKQLTESLKDIRAEQISEMILAYEPIWAIGTGRVAEAKDAQSAHQFCRMLIGRLWGEKAASEIVIQYGGSVKPENAEALLSQPDIDGLLVGGASLSAQAFSQIIHSYRGNT